jgi:hypothetical protein
MRGFPAVFLTLVVFFRGRRAARFFRFGATLRASVSGTSAFLASLTLAAMEPSVEPIDSATDTRSSLPFDCLLDNSSDIAPPSAPLSESSPNCINNSGVYLIDNHERRVAAKKIVGFFFGLLSFGGEVKGNEVVIRKKP